MVKKVIEKGLVVAVTTTSFARASRKPLDLLERGGFKVVVNALGRKMAADEVVEFATGAAGMIAGTEDLGRRVLERLPKLKVISRCGVGMDNVDLEAARELGVRVLNTPWGPVRAVSELAIGLMISLIREIPRMDRALRGGRWEKRMGTLLEGKQIGIVGFGRIGQQTARLLSTFGVELAYTDPNVSPQAVSFNRKELLDLLKWADIVCLHLSKPVDGRIVIGEAELALMKPGSYLINCARGEVIDEKSLHRALETGHLAGAALDAFCSEPYRGPLLELENVILTPHIGSYAEEARVGMEIQAVENLLKELDEALTDSH